MRVRWLVGLMAAAVLWSAGPAAAVRLSGRFIDDDFSIHESAIEAIAAAGITLGCNPPANDLFCPTSPVTRGQMAAFLHRGFAETLVPGPAHEFVDDDGSVFEADIVWLAAVGVTLGCNPPANDRFCPDLAVTRGEMAAFLVRALGLVGTTGTDFTDDNGSVFETDIERLSAAEITLGCNPPTNDRFCPSNPVSREEMASFLARGIPLDLLAPAIDLLAGWSCSKDGTSCTGAAVTGPGREMTVREGIYQTLPYLPGEEAVFTGTNTRFELRYDGILVDLPESAPAADAEQAVREWTNTITAPTSGSFTLDARWYWDGTLERRTDLTVTVTG